MKSRLTGIGFACLTLGAACWLSLSGGGGEARPVPGPRSPVPNPLPLLAQPLEVSRAAVQAAVDRAMSGRQGAAVALDAQSGRVLASHRIDLAARTLARPGSTLKPFVLAALLERGALPTARSSILCRRQVRIGGRNLDCSHPDATRPFDGAEALAYSCNYFFSQAAARLPPGALAQSLRRSIPSSTGLAPEEAAGAIEEPGSPDEQALLALGEASIRVTPLEMLAAYRRLLTDPATPAAVKAGLEGAAEFGSARLAQPEGMRVAGKTGTSTGLEAWRRYAWFVGAAPAGTPSVIVLVFLEQGRGGSDAAPVAGEIFSALRPSGEEMVTVRRRWIERPGGKPVSMPLDDYLAAVLVGEASGFRSMEALKAMAVLARGYARLNRRRHAAEGFDFCDTTHCQDFRGSAVAPRFRDAVAATRDEVLWYEGATAPIFYHADCGGSTESAERLWPGRAPYLRPRPDPYCVQAGLREWRVELGKDEIVRALEAAGLRTPVPLAGLEVFSRSAEGRAQVLKLAGAGAVTLAASSFRFAIGRALGWDLVRSTLFETHDAGDRLVFRGRGSGHAVGLCQTGAARMGEEGRSYREILAFYFPGTELRAAFSQPRWQAAGGERVEVLSARASDGAAVVSLADALARDIEERLGQPFAVRPQLRVYPSPAAFRDATGEPGWVAASTRGRIVRMQPPRSIGTALRRTLRHELLHVWIESHARGAIPLWFREGLALHLSEPAAAPGPAAAVDDRDLQRAQTRAELDRLYSAARTRVRGLADRFGEAAVLGWLSAGIPAGAREP